jgi:hypothetical protein
MSLRNAVALAATTGLLALLLASSASAAPQMPQWTVSAVSMPTNFAPGDESGDATFRITVVNSGGAASDGTPVAVADQLPAGISLDPAGASGTEQLRQEAVSCAQLTCTYSGVMAPEDSLTLSFPIDVEVSSPTTVTNHVSVSGGGAAEAGAETPTAISSTPARFGLAPGGSAAALSSNQAGAHADLTTALAFATTSAEGATAGDPKDAVNDLAPGFAGDLPGTPRCSFAVFSHQECPISTQVGVTTLTANFGFGPLVASVPLYNLSPDSGEVAKIGFSAIFFNIQAGISLRPGDEGLRTSFRNVTTSFAQLDSVVFTVWGVPAHPVHDPLRWNPAVDEFGTASQAEPSAFLTNPTSCMGQAPDATLTVDSWQEPQLGQPTDMPLGPFGGCDRLAFEPELRAQPTTDSATTASGLGVDVLIPQTFDNPSALATPHLRDGAVTLPEGMSLDPSAGAGLGSCTEPQFAAEEAQPSPGVGCPADSKVGTVRIESPSVAEPATGSLFVATPFQNPFHSLLVLYLLARIPDRGIVVRATGVVSRDPASGQLTTDFEGLPALPFADLTLAFRQGATAPLISPPTCGEFTVRAALTPFAAPETAVPATATFAIAHGVGGGPCPSLGPAPFHPRISAGTLNNTAGVHTAFYQDMSRTDEESEITHFRVHLPPGLTARLAGVPFCSEAAIEAAGARSAVAEEASPSCPQASQIGRTLVGAGVGSVLSWAPGRLYLAGPYDGAGLSTVAISAAKVGPFDLGTIVVRTALRLDPETAHVSIDSSGSAPIPRILDGVPLHVRDIRVYVDRPQFILNPTSCDPFAVDFDFLDAEGTSAAASTPFQVSDCSRLPFGPKFHLRLTGGTKRAGHPGFTASVTTTPGEANTARAEAILPNAAFINNSAIATVCTRVQFALGPIPGERCPPGSIYGTAKVESPLLSEPIDGLLYLRSSEHLLPDVVLAFHNAEFNVVLHGQVDSSKGRIRTIFEGIPDAPISRFRLTFPAKKGVIVNSKDLCAATYRMIVNLTGQNGKVSRSRPAFRPVSCAKRARHLQHSAAVGR